MIGILTRGALLALLAAPLLISLIGDAGLLAVYYRKAPYGLAAGFLYITVTGIILFLPRIQKLLAELSIAKFVWGAVILHLALCLVASFLFKPVLVSDFQRMHKIAAELSQNPPGRVLRDQLAIANLPTPEAKPLDQGFAELGESLAKLPTNVVNFYSATHGSERHYYELLFRERAFYYIYPVYALLGPNPAWADLINTILLTATGLLLLFICRRLFKNPMVARNAVIVFFLMPDHFFFLNLPFHEYPGLFLATAFIALFMALNNKIGSSTLPRLIGGGLLLGLLITLMQFTRTIGTFMWLAVALTVLMTTAGHLIHRESKVPWATVAKAVLFLLALPVVCYWLATSHLSFVTKVDPAYWFFMANDSHGSGRFSDYKKSKAYAFMLPNADYRNQYGFGRVVSELGHNYSQTLGMFERKFIAQMRYGDRYGWAFGDRKIHPWAQKQLRGFFFAYRYLFYLLSLAGLFYALARIRLSSSGVLMLCFALAVHYLYLLMLVQSRYLSVIHPYFAMLLAAGAVAVYDPAGRGLGLPGLRWKEVFRLGTTAVALGLGAVLVVGPWLLAPVLRASSLAFRDLPASIVASGNGGSSGPRALEANPGQGPLEYALRLPADQESARAAWEFQVGSQPHRISFFLQKAAKSRDGGVILRLGLMGVEQMQTLLSDMKTRSFYTYTVTPDNEGKVRLSLALQRQADGGAKSAEVEVQYLQLRPDRQ